MREACKAQHLFRVAMAAIPAVEQLAVWRLAELPAAVNCNSLVVSIDSGLAAAIVYIDAK